MTAAAAAAQEGAGESHRVEHRVEVGTLPSETPRRSRAHARPPSPPTAAGSCERPPSATSSPTTVPTSPNAGSTPSRSGRTRPNGVLHPARELDRPPAEEEKPQRAPRRRPPSAPSPRGRDGGRRPRRAGRAPPAAKTSQTQPPISAPEASCTIPAQENRPHGRKKQTPASRAPPGLSNARQTAGRRSNWRCSDVAPLVAHRAHPSRRGPRTRRSPRRCVQCRRRGTPATAPPACASRPRISFNPATVISRFVSKKTRTRRRSSSTSEPGSRMSSGQPHHRFLGQA